MAHRVDFSTEAEAQLATIYSYIAAAASPVIAQRFNERLVKYCQSFKNFPRRGTRRDDIYPGLRTVGFRKRVTIAFTVDQDSVSIVGVFYGGQDYQAVLREGVMQ